MLIILVFFLLLEFILFANILWFYCRQENVMQRVNRDELGPKDWSSKGNNPNPEGNSTVGFSLLDAMLKSSLDRLKSMRFDLYLEP